MAEINYDSVGIFGSGSVDADTAARLLDDWLPQNLGAVYRPTRVPRKHASLNAAINWLESDDVLGQNGTTSSDDLVGDLLKRKAEENDAVTLVVILPDEPTEDELKILREARDNDVPVKNLGGNGALDDLDLDELFPPEPEPTAEAGDMPDAEPRVADNEVPVVKSGEKPDVVAASAVGSALEDAIRAIVRDEIARVSGAEWPAMPEKEVAKLADKVAKKIDPPFDPPFKTGGDATEVDGPGKTKYYMGEDGNYRLAKARPRRGDQVVYLTNDEINDVVKADLMQER